MTEKIESDGAEEHRLEADALSGLTMKELERDHDQPAKATAQRNLLPGEAEDRLGQVHVRELLSAMDATDDETEEAPT